MTSYDASQPVQPAPWWPHGPGGGQPIAPSAVRPGLETCKVLLSLGALCLIVAFSAGIALVWSRLGVDGQLAVMLSVTAVRLGVAATL